MPRLFRLSRRAVFTLALLALGIPAFAQEALPETPLEAAPPTAPSAPPAGQLPTEITAAQVQQRIDEFHNATDLDDAAKAPLIDTYRKALAHVEHAARLRAKANEYARQRQEVPAALEEVRQRLANPPGEEPIDPFMPLAKFEQILTEQRGELVTRDQAVAAWDKEVRDRADRRLEAPKEMVAAAARLDELDMLLSTPDIGGDGPRLAAAKRMLLVAERQRRAAEAVACKQELLFYDATSELLTLQRDEAVLQKSRIESHVKRLGELVEKMRRREAEQSLARAQAAVRNAVNSHPIVQQIAADNLRLADLRAQLIEKPHQLWHDVEVDATRLHNLTKDLVRMQQRAELRGLDNIGVLLRKQGSTLPDPRQLRRTAAKLRSEMADIELAIFEAQDQRTGLSDIERLVENTLETLGDDTPLAERDNIELALHDQLQIQQKNLAALLESYKEYVLALDALASVRDELAEKSAEYEAFIAQRVLWVRSAELLGVQTLLASAAPLQSFADRQAWMALGSDVADDFLARFPLYLLALAAIALLTRAPMRLRRRLREAGKAAARSSTDSFRPTASAVLYTAALAAIHPAWMCLGAWLLLGSSNGWLAESIADGLLATALVFVPAETLRQVCRPQGLGEAHFGWPARSLQLLRRALLRLMLVGIPLVFVVAAIHSQDNDLWNNSLGRLAFLLLMIAVAAFLWRVLRPVGGILAEAQPLLSGTWVERFRLTWYPLAIGAPLALAGLMAWGFCYTAVQLAWRMQSTLGLILLLILLHALARRWLLVARRRLAMEQARQRRAALSESLENAGSSGDPTPAELDQADLSVVNLQTRKLLQSAITLALGVGLYLIWIDVLPALGILNQREMWSVTATDTTVDADGLSQKIERIMPVTWANGAMALLVSVMTILATRNIPGLLEITILQRLPLEPGGRYAITTIFRYVIIVTGVIVVCGQLGMAWSRVQWLAAAMTVGLGFGLQEIFANFVSGLIILFERPIRIGDTITVAGVSGKVTRIRTRATTITDHDRKELIVPNKEFITGQVLNWTLSDQVVRLSIAVGVAYESDTDLVQRLILEVARQHPRVLKDPPPSAYFEAFGDSTLNFTLRVHVPGLEHFLETRHALNTGIIQALRQANVEIAFPQRDLHIRSVGPILPLIEAERHAREQRREHALPPAHFAQRKHG